MELKEIRHQGFTIRTQDGSYLNCHILNLFAPVSAVFPQHFIMLRN